MQTTEHEAKVGVNVGRIRGERVYKVTDAKGHYMQLDNNTEWILVDPSKWEFVPENKITESKWGNPVRKREADVSTAN